MITCGIDIGKGRHAAAILDDKGHELGSARFYDNTREGAEALLKALARHASPGETHVGMESTGCYWRAFHDVLVKAGCEVDVINPIVTKAASSGDIRGRKTDKGDALVIARVVFGGNYTAKLSESAEERRLKALTRHRGFMVQQRTGFKLHFTSLLDEAFPEAETLFDDLFGAFATELLLKYPTARSLAHARVATVAKIVRAHTRGRDADAEAKKLIETARASLGYDCEIHEDLGTCIVSSLKSIRELDMGINAIEEEIEAFEDPKMAALMAPIKGTGTLLPKVIAAEYGDLSRFERDPKTGSARNMHKRLLAYAGCDPRIRESGKWKGTVFISKRGPGQLRTALYLVGNGIRMWDPYFKSVYDAKIAEKKHHTVAVFYVVAKLLEILCSLYRSGRTYTIEKPTSAVQR